MPAPLPPKERIRRNIAINDVTGCWNWTGARQPRGDGVIGVYYRKKLAHRVAYEDFVGLIPEGFQIDHLCLNPSCCNPSHLEAVSQIENLRRARASGRYDRHPKSSLTHCKHGHAFDATNVRITPQGWRDCKTCNRLKMRRRRAANKLSNGGFSLSVRT